MSDKFKVALSGDFRRPDGSPSYPDFDLTPLTSDPRIELTYVDPVDGVMPAAALAEQDAVILLVPRFDQRSIPASGRLALVARFGVGYDSVDVPACTQNAIGLAITPDGVRRPVAVSIVTFLLALTGKLFTKDRLTRQGPQGWAQRADHMGVGLVGRTFGQLGIGNIGAETIRLLRPFEMKLIAHDPFVSPAQAQDLGVELVGLEDLFRRSDVLSISVPLSETTHHLVGRELLGLMKPTAYLINTARGPVVDQKALYEALASRRIAGAGLDVFELEPTPADEPILALDNVILAPHSLCWTDQCFAGIGRSDVNAVLALMRGETPPTLVNGKALEADPRWQGRLAAYAARFGS